MDNRRGGWHVAVMSDAAMILDATARLLDDRIDDAMMRHSRQGVWSDEAWRALDDMGLPLALVDTTAGGFGIAPGDALALVRLTGRFALPLPLAETMLANDALGRAGLPLATGPAVLIDGAGLSLDGAGEAARLTGSASRVPWGRDVTTLVVIRDGRVVRLDRGWTVAHRTTNLAAMPRDTLAIDASCAVAGPMRSLSAHHAGAVARTLQIAGALERVLELTIGHVSDRVQFGRSIAKFQVVQHDLARLAGEVAAAGAAADMAVEAFVGDPARAPLGIAAARIRSSEAATVAAGIAQQLHGAIGFTEEHRLHWMTTALWSWRDEYGGPHHWADLLGRAALSAGGDDYWPFVTAVA